MPANRHPGRCRTTHCRETSINRGITNQNGHFELVFHEPGDCNVTTDPEAQSIDKLDGQIHRSQKVPERRLTRFNDQLSDMLNLMVNGLRAGYSTLQAMEAVSKELPTPISDEFRRVVQEMQIGIPMDTALQNLLRRIPSDDLDFVVTAINVQREVGGNLSEILDTISFTIRERVKIKEGTFENFEGVIENVDADRGKLRVSVTIFGRSTPVEVEYWQVERT